ncbi:MAG: hypothetical protein ABSF90_27710 [Syntrophobacteraceae bacterium]|jgi:hypothetical protein
MHKIVPFTLGLFLLIVSGTTAVPETGLAYSTSCNTITGEWAWFTGGTVTIYPDRTLEHSLGNSGTWRCVDPNRGIFTLRWVGGGYIDRLTLSEDGRVLAGTNQFGVRVTAKRLN